MTYPVEIRDLPGLRLAALLHVGPYDELGRTYQRLADLFSARGLWPALRGRASVAYDNPDVTPAAELKSHAGHIVDEDLRIEPPLQELRLAPGRHAVMTYTGPYAGLAAAYQQLFGLWLPQSGEKPADAPVYETYLNTPMDVPPEALITEICLPLMTP